jgi:hypothetical protein
MNRMRLLSATCFCALAAISNAFASDNDSEAMARARESLRRMLNEAEAAGVITARPEAKSAAPALRDSVSFPIADAPPSICLTAEALQDAAHSLEPDPRSALDRLRHSVIESAGMKGPGPEIALAKAYLVLGFAEESRAIAMEREGAEAGGLAALALLAEGRPDDAIEKSRPFRTCGGLYVFIEEAARVVTGRQKTLSAVSTKILEALPAPLASPIVEAAAIRASEAESPAAAAFPLFEAQAQQEKSEARRVLEAATSNDTAMSIATLSDIGAKPGPLRARALLLLSDHIDDDAPESMQKAFDDDASETIEDDPSAGPVARLSLALADRRAQRRDFSGAARALAAAFQHDLTRASAAKRFASIFSPLIRSQSPDERVSALAASVEFPSLAAKGLTDDDLRTAARQMAELGAVNSIEKLLAESSLPPSEIQLFVGEAAFHAGDFDAAEAALTPHADEKRALEMLRRMLIMSPNPEKEEALSRSLGQDAAADFFWRTGSFSKLIDLVQAGALSGDSARKALLAYAALRRFAPEQVIKLASDARASALFSSVPDAKRANGAELLNFTRQVSTSVEYLRKVLSDE